jgi:hypothetical protein
MIVLVGGGTLLIWGKTLFRLLRNQISNFRGGGPGTPSHPLPSGDSSLLTRRRSGLRQAVSKK